MDKQDLLQKKQRLIDALKEDTGYNVVDILEFDPQQFRGKFLVEGDHRFTFTMTPEKTTWEPIRGDE